jgi:ParB family chromosome partitioning protein
MEKRGLGKGLGALIADNLSEDGSSVQEISVERIQANPYQPRQDFNEERLAELTDSIREHGILQPILLRRVGMDHYEIIAGERRYRAACLLGLKTVPAIVRECVDGQALEIALIENIQREDINVLEAAQAYKRLIDEFGMTQSQVAKRVGKSQPSIANTLRLLSLPDPILASLSNGEITEGHARCLLALEGASQLSAFQRIVHDKLSVRDAERLVKNAQSNENSKPSVRKKVDPSVNPNLTSLEERLQVALGTRVRIRPSGNGGRIEIDYFSEEELEGVFQKIVGEEATL